MPSQKKDSTAARRQVNIEELIDHNQTLIIQGSTSRPSTDRPPIKTMLQDGHEVGILYKATGEIAFNDKYRPDGGELFTSEEIDPLKGGEVLANTVDVSVGHVTFSIVEKYNPSDDDVAMTENEDPAKPPEAIVRAREKKDGEDQQILSRIMGGSLEQEVLGSIPG